MKTFTNKFKSAAARLGCALLTLLNAPGANGQGLEWSAHAGSSNANDFGKSIAVDGAGNVYNTGYFMFSSMFGSGTSTVNLVATGNFGDIFVSKYNSTGSLQWAFKLGGSGWDEGTSVLADLNGNVLVTGYFSGAVDFDPGAGTTILTSGGASDAFIAKYTGAGVLVWAHNMENLSPGEFSSGTSVRFDAGGSIYVSGRFSGTVDFDPGVGTSTVTSNGGYDMFVAKFNSAGTHQWSFGIGGTDNDEVSAIAVNISGNVFLTGSFEGTMDFDPGAGIDSHTSQSTGFARSDIFVACYNLSGTFQWAINIGGNQNDVARAIAVDASSNVYITGRVALDNTDFDAGAGTAALTTGTTDAGFIAKYSSSGDYIWAMPLRGELRTLCIDGSGNICVAGNFSGNVDFDPGANNAMLSSQGFYFDMFVAKYTSSGNFMWAERVGSNFASGEGIAADGPGNVYLTGYFSITADFDPGTGTSLMSSFGGNDVFVLKLGTAGPGGEYMGITRTLMSSAVSVYPNPSEGVINVDLSALEDVSVLSVTNALGEIIYSQPVMRSSSQKTVDLRSQAAGIYFVSLRFGDKVSSKKIVLK